jgi:putative transposase
VSAFIEEHRERFGVEPICSALEVSASAYYERRSGRRSARRVEDERLLARIREIHERNYCAYGYRRTWIALKREGEEVGRGRVQRLMAEAGIQGAKRRGKALAHHQARSRGPPASRPGRARLQCGGAEPPLGRRSHRPALLGGPHLPRLRDRRLLAQGHRLAARFPHAHRSRPRRPADGARPTRPRSRLPARRPHRPRLPSADCTQELNDHGVPASVGSVGDAYDNAMAESFVVTFKTELIVDRSWRSRTQLELAVVSYIAWLNNDRLHEFLGDLPPAEFEDPTLPRESN